jgi:acyl dehydratase
MPLSSSMVGTSGEPLTQEIDARWTMSYSAGLGDTLPCYLDTQRAEGVVTHPLFPVCFEWPVILAARNLPGTELLTADESLRGVHATHDLLLHRIVRAGDRLTTRATIVGIEQRKPGAYQVTRVDTTDASGAPVCTTWYGTLYRGVKVEGADCPATDIPMLANPVGSSTSVRAEVSVPVSTMAAHVYTECARIWNPIHTDAAVAARAGLPKIILHGTATLALAVSRIVEIEARNNPELVQRVTGRFGAMVFMPSEIAVRILSREKTRDGDVVSFEVHSAEGGPAIRDGLVLLRV